jgi:hypothetical protein
VPSKCKFLTHCFILSFFGTQNRHIEKMVENDQQVAQIPTAAERLAGKLAQALAPASRHIEFTSLIRLDWHAPKSTH